MTLALRLLTLAALLAFAAIAGLASPGGRTQAVAQGVLDPRQSPAAPAVETLEKMRVFVIAEYAGPGRQTGEVWVYEGVDRFELVNRIPTGRWTHQLSASPDGRWVAAANRSGNSISVIDAFSMEEVARVPTGRTPHGVTWHTDSTEIYVAHENEFFIGRIQAGSWERMPDIQVGARQHVTASYPSRPNELWFTVAYTDVPDPIRMVNLETGAITRMPGVYVHDLMFTPDGSEVWVVHSGFLDVPDNRVTIYDAEGKRLKETIRLPGRYPFHTQKANRDGPYYMPSLDVMLLSDHGGPGLMWIDWRAREIETVTPSGRWAFHSAYNPLAHQVLFTSAVDGNVHVVDVTTREVVQQLSIPSPHGIVAIGIPRQAPPSP